MAARGSYGSVCELHPGAIRRTHYTSGQLALGRVQSPQRFRADDGVRSACVDKHLYEEPSHFRMLVEGRLRVYPLPRKMWSDYVRCLFS